MDRRPQRARGRLHHKRSPAREQRPRHETKGPAWDCPHSPIPRRGRSSAGFTLNTFLCVFMRVARAILSVVLDYECNTLETQGNVSSVILLLFSCTDST